MNTAFWPSFKTNKNNTTDASLVDPDRIDYITVWDGVVRVTYQSLSGKSETFVVYEGLHDVLKKIYDALDNARNCP